MCGIAGKVFVDLPDPDAADIVQRMCDAMRHRGPDGAGVMGFGNAVLGHRRLAIIDLSPLGAQPMSSADGRLHVTFNGEIYNFLELRRDLESLGHRFRSESDTEVILAAYGEYGAACVGRLRGMFAFAIWDAAERRLFAARDRLGKKPFYYWSDRRSLTFASEVQGLAADPRTPTALDATAVHHYLTFGYVPAPLSAFAGIQKLPPAHYLEYYNGRVRVQRYWSLRYEPKLTLSEEEAAEAVLEGLRESVRLRLISDVPVGAFLSGGVDSSVVTALMAERGPVRTFSIGFDREEYDERLHARAVAEHVGAEHEEFVVNPSAVEVLPRLVQHYGEPYADSSAIPTYYLAQLTRRRVTVALNGDGGDEALAGYDRYVAAAAAANLDWIPGGVRRALAGGARAFNRPTSRTRHRVDRFLAAWGDEPQARYGRWVTFFSNEQKLALYSDGFRREVAGVDSLDVLRHAYDESDARDFLDATLYADVQTYLPGDLLAKVDIATMAHGLEARSPLLDHEVLELCARLPVHLKVRGRTGKYLLKKIARTLVPAAVVDRPKKGFGAPIDYWLRGELRELTADSLLSARGLDDYLRRDAVAALVDQHWLGEPGRHHLVWNLLMLALWRASIGDSRRDRTAGVQLATSPP